MLSDNGILGSWMVLDGSIWWKISIQHWNNKWTNKTLIRTISSLLDDHLWLPYPIPSHFSSYFSCHIPRTHCIFKPHWFLLSVVPLLTSKPTTQRQHCFPWAFNTVAIFNYLICEQILLAKHMLSKGNADRKPKPRGPQIGGTKL